MIRRDYIMGAEFDPDTDVSVPYSAPSPTPAGTALDNTTPGANKIAYFNGGTTATTTDFTAVARTFVAATTQADQRTALGLGTSATVDTGTSGAKVPLLNTSVTWGGGQKIAVDGGAGFQVYNAAQSFRYGGWQSVSSGTYLDSYTTLFFRNNDASETWGSLTKDKLSLTGSLQATTVSLGIITATSTPYIVLASDYTILVNASSGELVVRLPTASSSGGRMLNIKKIDASANAATIKVAAGDSATIDGATSKSITAQWSSVTLHCNGTGWFVV